MATVSSETSALLIEQTLGAALSAVVEAQALAASTFTEIVQAVGFEDDPASPGRQRVKTFDFLFSRAEVDAKNDAISERTIRATMPFLSLFTLPAIAVDEATLEMDVRIVAHSTETRDPGPLLGPIALSNVVAAGIPRKLFVRQPVPRVVPLPGGGAERVDPAGTVHIKVTMRRQEQAGFDRMLRLLGDAYREEEVPPPP